MPWTLVSMVCTGCSTISFTPTAGTTYRLKISQPAGVSNEPKLPAVSADSEVVLNSGVGVFAAGKPLEFNIRSAKVGLPLVVAALFLLAACQSLGRNLCAAETERRRQSIARPNPGPPDISAEHTATSERWLSRCSR